MTDESLRDTQLLEYIVAFRTENGYPPSITEMVEHTGLARSTIQWHLTHMEERGRIVRRPQGARAITITAEGMKLITTPLEQL